MSTYLDLLPEELNEIIYKEVFKETLQELKKTSLCCSCDCIIYDCNDSIFNKCYALCAKCENITCYDCANQLSFKLCSECYSNFFNNVIYHYFNN